MSDDTTTTQPPSTEEQTTDEQGDDKGDETPNETTKTIITNSTIKEMRYDCLIDIQEKKEEMKETAGPVAQKKLKNVIGKLLKKLQVIDRIPIIKKKIDEKVSDLQEETDPSKRETLEKDLNVLNKKITKLSATAKDEEIVKEDPPQEDLKEGPKEEDDAPKQRINKINSLNDSPTYVSTWTPGTPTTVPVFAKRIVVGGKQIQYTHGIRIDFKYYLKLFADGREAHVEKRLCGIFVELLPNCYTFRFSKQGYMEDLVATWEDTKMLWDRTGKQELWRNDKMVDANGDEEGLGNDEGDQMVRYTNMYKITTLSLRFSYFFLLLMS